MLIYIFGKTDCILCKTGIQNKPNQKNSVPLDVDWHLGHVHFWNYHSFTMQHQDVFAAPFVFVLIKQCMNYSTLYVATALEQT